jgi:hypothetical protein
LTPLGIALKSLDVRAGRNFEIRRIRCIKAQLSSQNWELWAKPDREAGGWAAGHLSCPHQTSKSNPTKSDLAVVPADRAF